MKTVKQLFADAGVENAELVASVEQLVESAETQNTGIPKDRFNQVIKERNEARADLAEKEAELTELQNKLETATDKVTELDKVKNDYESLKHEQFKKERDRWIEKAKVFDVEKDDKLFDRIEKIRGDFHFHDKVEEYTPEEIAHNLQMAKPYEKIGYFQNDYTPPDTSDKKSKGEEPDKKIKSPFAGFPGSGKE